MSAKHLTPAMVARTVHVIDGSGILDLLCPPRRPGQVGRIGKVRENTRLLLLGLHLCTRLGQETTVKGAHEVLTEALPRDVQWELGVLRPLTTRATRRAAAKFDPDAPAVVRFGKVHKRIWPDDGVEEVGYDDLYKAATKIRERLDYGPGSAPNLAESERTWRRDTVEQVIDSLVIISSIDRTGSTVALDATGQWAWNRGPEKRRKQLETELRKANKEGTDADADNEGLELAEIAIDENDQTAPTDQSAPPPAAAQGRCTDAAWGYKTSKNGKKEVGYGFHQHTICRVPDPTADDDAEPLLVDGFVITPANAPVVEASLRLIDRIRARQPFQRLVGDRLYTNLKASTWAIPLAQRGIEQGLDMRTGNDANSDRFKITDILGAHLHLGWLHCPAAPLHQRPLPPELGAKIDWDAHHTSVAQFQREWAFDRKESGLGHSLTSKWICPAMAGKGGCHARGRANVAAAQREGLPIITPPEDWQDRKCCTGKTIDFTPEPDKPEHQRKLMQRHYYGSRNWRQLYKRRGLVEGAFGILKNSSRQRLRRGQNRMPGLAMASLIAAIKISLFNEEQLRSWHTRTGRGPIDHPLIQPDPSYWGFRDLTKAEAKAIDAERLAALRQATDEAA